MVDSQQFTKSQTILDQDLVQPAFKKNVRLILIAVVLLGALLRFYGLDSESLWYDETNSIFLSESAGRGLELFNVDHNTDPPFFLILLFGWRKLLSLFGLPSNDWFLRLLPCIFSILTVPVVYGAAKEVFSYSARKESPPINRYKLEYTALAASFLVALSPFHRFYAHELRNYSLLTLLAALILWVFIVALRKNHMRYWMLLSLFLSFAFWTHFFAVWLFAVLNLYLLFTFSAHKKYYFRWTVCQIIAGILCLPALYLAWKVSQIVDAITVQWMPAPNLKTLFITYKTFFAGYSPRAMFYRPLFLLSLVLTASGLWSIRHRKRLLLLLLLWTGLAMTGSVLIWSQRGFSYYELRLFIWCALGAAFIAGHGWAVLEYRLRIASLILIMFLTTPLLYDGNTHALHSVSQHRLGVRHKVDNRAGAQYLSREAFAGEPVYHASHVTLSPFRFYLPGHHQTHVCRTKEEEAGFFSAYPNRSIWINLEFQPYLWSELKDKPATFWWVRSWWEPFEIPFHVFELEEEISRDYTVVEELQFFGITLIHYYRK